jgi:hypothetical protein
MNFLDSDYFLCSSCRNRKGEICKKIVGKTAPVIDLNKDPICLEYEVIEEKTSDIWEELRNRQKKHQQQMKRWYWISIILNLIFRSLVVSVLIILIYLTYLIYLK